MQQIAAGLLFKDGKLLIAQRAEKYQFAGLWEFPGGKLEADESPEECLRREMMEEFGIIVGVDRLYTESVYRYSEAVLQLLFYLTVWLAGELTPKVHSRYLWVEADQLEQYPFLPANVPLLPKIKKDWEILKAVHFEA